MRKPKTPKMPEPVLQFFRATGALGGRTRAEQHTAEELSEWGKKGGRPKGSGKNRVKRGEKMR